MNQKERFLGTLNFKNVDRVPDYEFGFWAETVDRWHCEGLPKSLKRNHNRDIELYLGLEGWDHIPERVPVRTGFWSKLPEKVVKKDGDRAIVEDGMGGIYVRTLNTSSIPHYIRHPIKNKEDWEKLRPFFDPDNPNRFPSNWDEKVESYRERDYPLGIEVGSLYGWIRDWMGVEGISIAFYRDPDWVAEMMDTLVHLWVTVVRKVLRSVQVDFAEWWEDMCYSKGPLLSVRLFEEYMVPRYKQVTEILREHGVNINIVDSDGDITMLVPGWLKAGLNCMFPCEARFTDIYGLRENFGHRVLLMGGVDKRALVAGRKEIDEELKRLAPLLEEGGFIPMVDHRCPPEVSYSTYRYYLRKKRVWIGRKDTEPTLIID